MQLANFIITPVLNIIGLIFDKIGINTILNPISDTIDLIFSFCHNLLWLVLDLDTLAFILKNVIIIETAFTAYRITMWALKKIPKLNIQE